MTVINNIKYLSQQDPRWSMDKIGDSTMTIWRYGCTTTCISMLTDYFGCYQTPDKIATNLKNYIGGNVWWSNLDFPTFSFRWEDGNQMTKNPKDVDLNIVKAWLAPNPDRACILEVANGSHWVVGLWYNDYDQDILAIDPWTGTTCYVFKTYKNITEASLFIRWDKTKHGGKKAFQWAIRPVSPLFN